MRIDLSGETALVTGSTAGIGRAIAEKLSGAGAHVILNGRNSEAVARATEEVCALTGGPVSGIACDVTTAKGASELFERFPAVDLLINNAGQYRMVNFLTSTDADWSSAYEINVLSAVRLARHYMPAMLRAGRGRVIFLSSDNALTSPEGVADYSAAKAALLSVSRSLAKLARGTAVTVNVVLPGATLSRTVASLVEPGGVEGDRTSAKALDDFVKAEIPTSLIERGLMPEEIASMICYLCSSFASGTTGSALRVDGGAVDMIM